jgi:hypothetical protein
MRFVVHATDAAQFDAGEAAGWYESRQPGLGSDFRMEVILAARNLTETALQHRIRFCRCAPGVASAFHILRFVLRRVRYAGNDLRRCSRRPKSVMGSPKKKPSWLRRITAHGTLDNGNMA